MSPMNTHTKSLAGENTIFTRPDKTQDANNLISGISGPKPGQISNPQSPHAPLSLLEAGDLYSAVAIASPVAPATSAASRVSFPDIR